MAQTNEFMPPQAEDLRTAVGLVWGWLEQGQTTQALSLVRACRACWADQAVLQLLHNHCLLVLGLPEAEAVSLMSERLPEPWRELSLRLDARRRLNDRQHSRTRTDTGPR